MLTPTGYSKCIRLAKQFATEIRGSNLALFFPSELIDQLSDEELESIRDQLTRRFHLVQRNDGRWEEKS